MASIVVKAVVKDKRFYADGIWDWLEKNGNENGIAVALNDAEEDPFGTAARWLIERNARIERYTKQAEVGPIQFEHRRGRNQN